MKKNIMAFKNIFIPLLVAGLFLASCTNGQKSSGEGVTANEVIEQKASDEPLTNQNVAEQKSSHKPLTTETVTEPKSTINTDLFIGSWKDQSRAALDFTLFSDGRAKSDNMTSLLYQNWSVKGKQLYLVAKSVGNGTSSVSTEVYEIQKLDKAQMVLKRGKLISTYKKEQ